MHGSREGVGKWANENGPNGVGLPNLTAFGVNVNEIIAKRHLAPRGGSTVAVPDPTALPKVLPWGKKK